MENRRKYGNVFAGQLKEGNYPWEEDEEGCLISSGLAEKLFGTERIQGNQVQIFGKTYIVRGCIKSRDSFCCCLCRNRRRAGGNFFAVYRPQAARLFGRESFDSDNGQCAGWILGRKSLQ